ncbi:MAG: hypothetical protein ACRCR9_05050 [Chitinophagaceae bacterium]
MLKKSTLTIGQVVLKVDSQYFRPTEVELLIGNPTKSKSVLGCGLPNTISMDC